MTKPYKITYESPEVTVQAEADTFGALKSAVAHKLSALVSKRVNLDGLTLDDAAIAALSALNESRNEHRRYNPNTNIACAGVEFDVVRCYLRRMTIDQIVSWLKRNREFKTSRSAVGRISRALNRIGVYPLIHTAGESK